MAATYNPALTTPLDKVRFAVGDTDVSAAIIPDETILALLAETGATPVSVAASVAQSIYTIFTQAVTYDVDGQGEKLSDRVKNYANTVSILMAKAAKELLDNAGADVVAASEALGGGIMPMGVRTSDNVRRSEDPERAANFSPRYGY